MYLKQNTLKNENSFKINIKNQKPKNISIWSPFGRLLPNHNQTPTNVSQILYLVSNSS